MITWWLRYASPILCILVLIALQKITASQIYKNYENSCVYTQGKYKLVTKLLLKKAISNSKDQLIYKGSIPGKCISDQKISLKAYIWQKKLPEANQELIVKGALYVSKNNKLSLYVKHWFVSGVINEKMSLNNTYRLLNQKVRYLFTLDYALIQAAIFGHKEYLDKGIKNLFRRLGIGHLLVVSGIHFVLIVLSLKNIVLKILYRSKTIIYLVRYDYLDFILSALMGYIYLSIVQFPVSAQRAYVFIVLSKALHSMAVKSSLYSLLFSAALFVYLFDPEQLKTLSFLYSFSCVFVLALFLEKHRSRLSTLKSYLGVFALTQLLSLFFFSKFNPLAWLTNIIFIPTFSLMLMFYCLNILLLTLLSWAIQVETVSQWVHFVNGCFINILEYVSDLGSHEINFTHSLYVYLFKVSLLALLIFQCLKKIRAFKKLI